MYEPLKLHNIPASWKPWDINCITSNGFVYNCHRKYISDDTYYKFQFENFPMYSLEFIYWHDDHTNSYCNWTTDNPKKESLTLEFAEIPEAVIRNLLDRYPRLSQECPVELREDFHKLFKALEKELDNDVRNR